MNEDIPETNTEEIKRFRNKVKLCNVVEDRNGRGRYAFGIIMDGSPNPNFVFFSPSICASYDIIPSDVGEILDCVFCDDVRRGQARRDPVVVAIMEEGDEFQDSRLEN